MNFSGSDFPHIRASLIVFLVTLLAGGSAVYLTQDLSDRAHRTGQSLQHQMTDARNRLNVANDDLSNLSTYATEYNSWVKRKIIGEEHRLDLLENLEALRKQNLVLDFKYSISPQQPYTPNPPVSGGNFDLRQSSMSLQMDLLHEGQLINFFNALSNSGNGWFILDHCELNRAGAVGSAVQLRADCSGFWLTIKNRSAQ